MGNTHCVFVGIAIIYFSFYSSYSTFLAPFPPTLFSSVSSSRSYSIFSILLFLFFPFFRPLFLFLLCSLFIILLSRSPPVPNFGEQVAQLCGSGDEGELIKTTLHSRHPETHNHPDHEDRRG